VGDRLDVLVSGHPSRALAGRKSAGDLCSFPLRPEGLHSFRRGVSRAYARLHRLPKWSPRCGGCDERDDRGGGEGALSICHEDSADTYSLVENVKTLPGARTMALDRKTGVVYLPVADVGAAPASTADNPRPRRRKVPGTFSVLAVGR